MAATRISKVLKEFNIALTTLVNFLEKKGIAVEANPNAKIDEAAYELVSKEFRSEHLAKEEAQKVKIEIEKKTAQIKKEAHNNFIKTSVEEIKAPVVVGKIDIEKPAKSKDVAPKIKTEEQPKPAAKQEAPKVEPKPEKKPEQQSAPEKKVEQQQQQKPEKKVEQKPQPKVVAQPQQQKPEQKPQPQKTEQKPQPKVEQKVEQHRPEQKPEQPQQPKNSNFIETKVEQLQGPKDTGMRVDLSKLESGKKKKKGKRERIGKHTKEKVDVSKEADNSRQQSAQQGSKDGKGKNNKKLKKGFKPIRNEVDEDEVQKQIKETYQRMIEGKGKTKGSKYRREKREMIAEKAEEEIQQKKQTSNILKVTEFVTVNDLAVMIEQPVTKVIGACMNLGLMVSINQRLDADALTLVAEDFGYKIEFVTAEIQEAIKEENVEDKPEDMQPRAPIVTVMGHVDHGKTSLLDYIRQSNVIAGEAGGITQHIGAYNVKLPSGRRITFLDTPGHEAFTAMRARGAKMTDLAIIIVAADDAVMPQTVEAINHAQAAGVPMIFAINKIDKPGAQPEKIKEQLSQMNILVEDWGGKFQCQEISAKKGIGVNELLDKVLLEADLLELKANPNKKAMGTVIESSLDKGRGYLATLLVQGGTLHTGDIMLSGMYTGKVKAMFNERGQKIDSAGPSVPVSVLGLNGAPQAGDSFNIFDNERDARELANKREQLIRIQGIRTQKHVTLEELGRRIAIGNFKELNIIVKGDVDGSIEALSGSLIKLSTEEVRVNVIHKAVGEISESDVLLAEASEAIIIGFQVRPSVNARKMAEKEEIEIRLYSVIYDAINEVKSGIEGMLAPVQKEVVTSTLEVRQTFKISKVGTIAGCMVKEGKITRTSKIRLIRDGIVIKEGTLASLKRGKDDAKEVSAGYDCGVGIENFNDIKEGDIIEAYKIEEIKRSL